MPAVKCEICNSDVDADNIESTSDYETVCSPCYENSFWECADCGEMHHDNAGSVTCNHGTVCDSCYSNGNYATCQCCDDIISLNNENYHYDGNYSCDYACDDCSDEEMRQCDNCGQSIVWSEAGSDNDEQGLCYDCYNNNERMIEHTARGRSVSISKILLRENYKDLKQEGLNFCSWFYRGDQHDFQKIDKQIVKGIGGAGTEEGFWSGKMQIKSQIYAETASILRRMISDNAFVTEHKKYGLYHPIRHIFRECIHYRHNEHGGILGLELAMGDLGSDYFNYRLELVDSTKIATMLENNKTEDGADLRRALHQVFSRAYKQRFPQYAASYEASNRRWESTMQKYNTNASNIELNVQIGYHSGNEFNQEVVRFNEAVSSCQIPSNRTSYAWGYMDMFTNPHIFALIRDPKNNDQLIGRSLIRFFKHDWEDEEEPIHVAPSRLYLSHYTHSKKDAYVGLFTAVNDWCKEQFDNYKIIAYSDSRHDSSVRSYIRRSNKFRWLEEDRRHLYTQRWLPFWRSTPDASDASFHYYQDEGQRAFISSVEGASLSSEKFAIRERLYGSDYYTLEVLND